MIAASVTAARERMHKLVFRLTMIELFGVGVAVILSGLAVAAVHADSMGQKWPTVITSLIAAGLVLSLLGAGLGWALGGQATALARRIDIAAAMADQGIAEARVIRAQQEAMHHVLLKLVENDQAMIAELGRMRYDERERLELLGQMKEITAKAITVRTQPLDLDHERDKAFKLGYRVRDAELRSRVTRLKDPRQGT